MANPSNNFSLAGHLASAPRIFKNSDGSRTVRATVYARNNYASGPNREYASTPVDIEQYLPAARATDGIYPHLTKGDLIVVSGHIESRRFTTKVLKRNDANQVIEVDETIYRQVLAVDEIQPLGPKKNTASAPAAAAEPTVVAEADQVITEAPQAPAEAPAASAEVEAPAQTLPAPHEAVASDNPPF